LWGLAHAFPSFGAWMADALRSVFGARFVAWLEDVAYDVKDWYARWRHGDDAPATLWEIPTGAPGATDAPPPPPAPTASAPDGGAPEPPFAPPAAELPFEKVASPGDGAWIAMPDAARPTLAPALFKTMIHPDPRRPFTVLAVVAVALRAIELSLVAGVTEPESMSIRMADRPGKIPNDDWDALVAAFNGGFKAVHGQYGMMIDGKTFLPPQEFACTIVRYLDGSLRIGSWSDLKADRERMAYLRQAPPCLVEGGDVHKALLYNEYAKGWGATVSGDTVIRRSALGLDATGQVLFYGIGEALTAQSLAQGMRAVGSDAVAELDVNYSYPRFLTYKRPGPGEPPRVDSPLIPNIDATPDQYVTRPSARDFFYLARRPERLPPPGAAPPATAEPDTSATGAPSASGSTSASGSASAPPGMPAK
ncbi:MAG: hypothetical protein HY908_22540, partial [Myxococcales bacterium]|nr:hypothetical protein [Myxococcales bacterium]